MVRAWLAILAVLIGIGLSNAAESNTPLPSDKRWQQARKDLAEGRAAAAKS